MRAFLVIALTVWIFFSTHFLHAQSNINMTNGKFSICKGKLLDSDAGKTPKDYDHNEFYILTLSIPGAKSISLNFTSFCTEKDNDILSIYNGKDTNAPLIGRYSGNKGPGLIKTTDSFVTLMFKSDKSIACTGWEAEIIREMLPISAPILSLVSAVKCKANKVQINLNKSIPCDSLTLSNVGFSGPGSPSISSINALNCNNGRASRFEIGFSSPLSLNGNYSFQLTSRYKDFCDSIYILKSNLNFSITDCPLTVLLRADKDTLCKGSCTILRTTVSGGNPSRYVYTWSPALIGAGPHRVCPSVNTRYILTVTDGSSIPSSDTVDIVVLDPPNAQIDTSVCYLSAAFNLRATPLGGRWMGKGITNSTNGTFNPSGNYGVNKVWYQIGNCADTVLVTVTNIWNLENVFCPNAGPSALYWYGPTGGTWSGTGVTSAGIFTPDTPGRYLLTYDWKGCIGTKVVKVEQVYAKPFDTVCESSTFHQLTFSPKGAYLNWFPGLLDAYNGRINPSLMGGFGNRLIIWNGIGCRDTTVLTILPSDAGRNDTICPSSSPYFLSGYRPLANIVWKGKGIIDSLQGRYDPSFYFNQNKNTLNDTLTLITGKCSDRKFIHITPTQIKKKDTVFVCPDDTAYWFTDIKQQTYPTKSSWTGPGVQPNGKFVPNIAGIGLHQIRYVKNGCEDSMYIRVRPRPFVPNDTAFCINQADVKFNPPGNGGFYWGTGITDMYAVNFSPSKAGKGVHTIYVFSGFGCRNNFNIKIDTVPSTTLLGLPNSVCFKDTLYVLNATPLGGNYFGNGLTGNQFNPKNAGSGNHIIQYRIASGSCIGNASASVWVNDTLKVKIDPSNDSICNGTTLRLFAYPNGGDKFNYQYQWSTGINDKSTFVQPKGLTRYTVTVNDGCSDPATGYSDIFVHPKEYFNVVTSLPACFGLSGFAKVSMTTNAIYQYTWNSNPPTYGDSIWSKVGYNYGLTAYNTETGCYADTTVEIPGFKSLIAAFAISPFGECLSNINATLRVSDLSRGGTQGTWIWGDGSTENYIPGNNPSHFYSGDTNRYKITLLLTNDGGCKDTAEINICYRDTVLLFIPNGFSPNNDGINDEFTWSAEGVKEFEFSIYNRWGERIFETTNSLGKWDGIYKGRTVSTGFYPFQITYKGRKTAKKAMSGVIFVIP